MLIQLGQKSNQAFPLTDFKYNARTPNAIRLPISRLLYQKK
jgi:hypothetical protein